jgi:hypothetical protein
MERRLEGLLTASRPTADVQPESITRANTEPAPGSPSVSPSLLTTSSSPASSSSVDTAVPHTRAVGGRQISLYTDRDDDQDPRAQTAYLLIFNGPNDRAEYYRRIEAIVLLYQDLFGGS